MERIWGQWYIIQIIVRWASEEIPYIWLMTNWPSMWGVHRINTPTLIWSMWLVASSDGPGEAAATREDAAHASLLTGGRAFTDMPNFSSPQEVEALFGSAFLERVKSYFMKPETKQKHLPIHAWATSWGPQSSSYACCHWEAAVPAPWPEATEPSGWSQRGDRMVASSANWRRKLECPQWLPVQEGTGYEALSAAHPPPPCVQGGTWYEPLRGGGRWPISF